MLESPTVRATFLAKLRANNPISRVIRNGTTPEQFHNWVLEKLSPFFSRRDVLEHFALSVLAPQAVNLTRIQHHAGANEIFRHCVDISRGAHDTDAEQWLSATKQTFEDSNFGVSELWSTANLERDVSALPLLEFKTEAFRLIGALIEASLQPFLRELLVLNRIKRARAWNIQVVRSMKLGNVVEELSATSDLSSLIVPQPWGVRLNQWRNIAQHHLATIKSDNIVLSPSAAKTHAEIWLAREDVLQVCRDLIALFTAVKAALEIVQFDLLGGGIPCLHPEHGHREEAVVMHFAWAVSTQGFELMDIEVSSEKAWVDLGDIIIDDEMRRIAHASQLLQLLFGYFPRTEVGIRYFRRDGWRSVSEPAGCRVR